jgi:hypothetical protein
MALHQRRCQHPWCWLLVPLLLVLSTSSSNRYGSLVTAAAYTSQVQIQRTITHLGPKQAYARCLNGWRRDNFGFYFLLPTFVLESGDDDTGVGMVIVRVPPLFLKEGIVDATFSSASSEEERCSMTYQVLNPGWFTFPFAEHIGEIEFISSDDDAASCHVVWTAQWTPLEIFPPLLQPAFDKFLEIVATGIVGVFSNYLIQVE